MGRRRPGWRHLLRACWSVRLAALAMVGPALGLLVIAASFGLAPGLARLFLAAALLDVALLGLLVRAECRRLAGMTRRAR